MIAPLRRLHRRSAAVLSVTAPLVLLVSLWARQPDVLMAELPVELGPIATAPDATALVSEHPALWDSVSIGTRFYAASPSAPPSAVELTPEADLRRPDLLLYWMPAGAHPSDFPAAGNDAKNANRANGASIPTPEQGGSPATTDRAVLLGEIAGVAPHRFALPEPRGTLLLYSVGHRERVAAAVLPASDWAR